MEIRPKSLRIAISAALFATACGHGSPAKRTASTATALPSESPAPEPDSSRNKLSSSNQTIVLIQASQEIPGIIKSAALDSLEEPLRALAALYAATGGSDCDGENCALTTALKLGKQGSAAHKALIQNYFPTDTVAKLALAQDCYLRPSGASSFTDYAALSFGIQQDTVTVDYKLLHFNQGKTSWKQGPDKYIFHAGTFSRLNRTD